MTVDLRYAYYVTRGKRSIVMCGIAGLFLKNALLEADLGRLTAGMLDVLSERGPDSAGFAIYSQAPKGQIKLTLRGVTSADLATLAEHVPDAAVTQRDDHALLVVKLAGEEAARDAIATHLPGARVASRGASMELYKGLGRPADVTGRLGLTGMHGSHAIGHTRMATESAVTLAGAHPFSTGTDQCLVHNGSLSNHNDLRRRLKRAGQTFETANDSEVAAGYLTWRMHGGAKLDEALTAALADLDGFYTFVVGTESGFGVLRDRVACKPAVMAETDDYVAFGSEYRALAGLPGIESATIFEPQPQRVYFWERRP